MWYWLLISFYEKKYPEAKKSYLGEYKHTLKTFYHLKKFRYKRYRRSVYTENVTKHSYRLSMMRNLNIVIKN